MHLFCTFAAVAVLLAPASAQCSTLSTSGALAAGSTFGIAVSGAPANALTFIAAGETQGSTTFGGGPFSITIDLDLPFLVLPMGFTDANGDVSVSFDIPSSAPMIPSTTIYLQAATLDFSFGGGPPTLTACTSNVVSVTT